MGRTRHTHIVLLLADGFEEAVVITLLTTLREAGLRATTVALRSEQVTGAHGVVIKPDASLDRLLEMDLPISALILPEGGGHLERLGRDPRVALLLRNRLVDNAEMVGLGKRACKFLEAYSSNAAIRCISLGGGETCINNLARQIAAQLLELGRN